jgi:hypothetical protein
VRTFYEEYGGAVNQLDQASADEWLSAKVAEKVVELGCTADSAISLVRLNLNIVASHEQTDVRHRMEKLYRLGAS